MEKPTARGLVTQPMQKHHRQTAWQVLVAFFVVTAGLVTLMVLVLIANSASGSLEHLANLSILWLILPALGITGFLVVILIASIVLVARITAWVPLAGLKTSTFVYQAAIMIHKAADSAAAPAIKVKEISAGAQALFRRKKNNL